MSYRADKQVIDTHTHTDRYTDRGDDNTRRPKLASGKNCLDRISSWNQPADAADTSELPGNPGTCNSLTHSLGLYRDSP